MQFVFNRDEEGHERIYVGDVCVARMRRFPDFVVTEAILDTSMLHPLTTIGEAIERADEAGFWDDPMHNSHKYNRTIVGGVSGPFRVSEATVDVPVADNAVLSVMVGGDES